MEGCEKGGLICLEMFHFVHLLLDKNEQDKTRRGEFYMEGSRIPIILLRGQKSRFWSNLSVQDKTPLFFSHQGIF